MGVGGVGCRVGVEGSRVGPGLIGCVTVTKRSQKSNVCSLKVSAERYTS